MITYIIVKEDNESSFWNKYFYMFQAFEWYGKIKIIQWDKGVNIDRITDDIGKFLIQTNAKKWQLILLDGSHLYESEHELISGELLGNLPQMDNNPPVFMHLLIFEKELFTGNIKDGITQEDIFGVIPSNCRLFCQDVFKGIHDMTEYEILYALCNTLMIAQNDWYGYPLEYGYVYRIIWEVDGGLAEKYMKAYMQECRKLEEGLRNTTRLFGKFTEEIQDFNEPDDTVASLSQEDLKLGVRKTRFSFLTRNGEDEVFDWKLLNHMVIEQVKKFYEWPIGRWEREIATCRRFIVSDLDMQLYSTKRLSAKAEDELTRKKEKCVEKIFAMEHRDKKFNELIDDTLMLEKRLEKAIRTRMDRESFLTSIVQSLFPCIFLTILTCFAIVFVLDEGQIRVTEIKQIIFVTIILILFVICLEVYLYVQRGMLRNRTNTALQHLVQAVKNQEANYQKLLNNIVKSKRYSFLLQQQRYLKQKGQIWKHNLECHREQLIQYSLYCKILSKALSVRTEMPEFEVIQFHGFLISPMESGYYFSPDICDMILIEIEGNGIQFKVPYPFIKNLKIKKYRLPITGSKLTSDIIIKDINENERVAQYNRDF